MDTRVHINTSYKQSWESNMLRKLHASLQQVLHQMRVWGGEEEGMREQGDRGELEIMGLHPEIKTP